MDLHIPDALFPCFAFKQAGGKRSHVDRRLHLFEKLGQSTHYIVMAVCDKHTLDALFIFHKILKVRCDHFNAELFIRGRIAHTAFNHKDIVIIFNNEHVFAVFVESAERKNTYLTHRIIPPFKTTFNLL